MPQNGLRETAGAAVMQVERMPGDGLREANTPEGCCSPLTRRRRIFRSPGQSVAHIVQQEIRVGLNIALVQDGERMGVTGAPIRTVAGGAANFGEEPRTRLDLGGIGISRKGRSNSLQIEGQMTEHFVRDLNSVMAGTVAVRAGLTWYSANTGKCHAKTQKGTRCTKKHDASGLCSTHRSSVINAKN